MRIPTTLSLRAETVVELRQTADRLNVPLSTLVDLCIRGGLKRLGGPALETWAAAQREKADPKIQSLRSSERNALAALTPEFAESRAIRAASGLGAAVCWRALKGLEAKGLAESLIAPDVVTDDKGRPLVSQWRRKGATNQEGRA